MYESALSFVYRFEKAATNYSSKQKKKRKKRVVIYEAFCFDVVQG